MIDNRRSFLGSLIAGIALGTSKKAKAATGKQGCTNCYYYTSTATMCMRFPPSKPGVFPLVGSSDWCGEYKVGPGPYA